MYLSIEILICWFFSNLYGKEVSFIIFIFSLFSPLIFLTSLINFSGSSSSIKNIFTSYSAFFSIVIVTFKFNFSKFVSNKASCFAIFVLSILISLSSTINFSTYDTNNEFSICSVFLFSILKSALSILNSLWSSSKSINWDKISFCSSVTGISFFGFVLLKIFFNSSNLFIVKLITFNSSPLFCFEFDK